MNIISDFKNLFKTTPATEFIIHQYDKSKKTSDLKVAFSIYGVLDFNRSQSNIEPEKPVEGGNFRHDSQWVKPYTISLTGILKENNPALKSIENAIEDVKQYLNGIKLLSIVNANVFEVYAPVKLYMFNSRLSVDQTIPLVSLGFVQIMLGEESELSNSNVRDAENKPII